MKPTIAANKSSESQLQERKNRLIFETLKNLIQKCWSDNPESRPSSKEGMFNEVLDETHCNQNTFCSHLCCSGIGTERLSGQRVITTGQCVLRILLQTK